MEDRILIAIVVGTPFLIWYVIKRLVYSLIYVAKRAVEDAKEKKDDKRDVK